MAKQTSLPNSMGSASKQMQGHGGTERKRNVTSCVASYAPKCACVINDKRTIIVVAVIFGNDHNHRHIGNGRECQNHTPKPADYPWRFEPRVVSTTVGIPTQSKVPRSGHHDKSWCLHRGPLLIAIPPH
jgi:hypothetical protein